LPKAQLQEGCEVPFGNLPPQLTKAAGMKESSTMGFTPCFNMLS